ncbi:MAG: gamma-glutamyltransferase family protein [Defluviitaleaceae bacterium]|nr:gamma-glutamyltransferase family protein [Defluviitaleaceae bacterium]
MNFDPNYNPYPSHRSLTYGKNGMVATSQPLAAQAGLEMLKKGGNAIDAAIATAACLTVVEPTSNGIGGDAFALVWTKGKLHGLNASGPAPHAISIDKVKALGHEKMPTFGWIPVTVPGAPAAWAALSEQFGTMPLIDVLEPAMTYARTGYPISPVLGYFWQRAYTFYQKKMDKNEFFEWYKTFAPKGRAPQVGEIFSSAAHGKTLEEIGETKAKSFYHGQLAEKIVRESKRSGGFLTAEDLTHYQPEWVAPISLAYRGYDIWELPPNGQGLVALTALNILKEFSLTTRETTETIHKQIEALKIAFTAGKKAITDPKLMDTDQIEALLSDDFAKKAVNRMHDFALETKACDLAKGGTVYLCTADSKGNMVSYIQSNYMGFGSGIVIPDTGIALQNRGADFSLDPAHANALAGGKKTYHTIIPGFLTKAGQAVGPFGVMGGYMQPQGHVQVMMNMIDFNLNPQMALDAPRFQWLEGKRVEVETHFPTHLAKELANKGHDIQVTLESGAFGRGQVICRDPKTGVLCGATESRCDGSVVAY